MSWDMIIKVLICQQLILFIISVYIIKQDEILLNNQHTLFGSRLCYETIAISGLMPFMIVFGLIYLTFKLIPSWINHMYSRLFLEE